MVPQFIKIDNTVTREFYDYRSNVMEVGGLCAQGFAPGAARGSGYRPGVVTGGGVDGFRDGAGGGAFGGHSILLNGFG